MPRAESQKSWATRMARWVIEQPGGANTAEVAAHFGRPYKSADAVLRQRASTVGDIRRGRGVWIASTVDARAMLARKKAREAGYTAPLDGGVDIDAVHRAADAGGDTLSGGPGLIDADGSDSLAVMAAHRTAGSGVIAGLRQAPDRGAVWRGHANPGPMRPGARDYEAIPSRMGDARHQYHSTRASVPHVEPAPKRGRPSKALKAHSMPASDALNGAGVGAECLSATSDVGAKPYGRNYRQPIDVIPGVYSYTQAPRRPTI